MPHDFTLKRHDSFTEASDATVPAAPATAADSPADAGAHETRSRENDVLERLKRLNEEAGSFKRESEPDATVVPAEAAPLHPEINALERLARLNEALRTRPEPEIVEPQSQPTQSDSAETRTRRFMPSGRVIKTVLALAVAIALAWVPAQRLLTTRSAEATVNARLVNLRAPINGKVAFLTKNLSVGTLIDPGQPLLQLVNSRADRQRLDDLQRQVNSLRTETTSLKRRIELQDKTRAQLTAQTDAFQQSRILQLEAREAELQAEVKAAEAHLEDAIKSYKRSKDLEKRGIQTVATLLHAERDMKVAEQKVDVSIKRLDSNKIELDGARNGYYVGDSYNDVPRSAQRLNEVEQQHAELTAQLAEREAQLASYTKDLAAEQTLFKHNTTADVTATDRGRIWELLTANGEDVLAGQDLLRVLDCGAAMVTATVSESVYNGLWVGQPVEFALRGEGKALAGTVAALTGLTPAGSNLAIAQTALTREPYHVTIAVPALAARNECSVGRMGSVTFNTTATPTAAPAATTAATRSPSAAAAAPAAAPATADASAAVRNTNLAMAIGRTGHKLANEAGRATAAVTLTASNALKAFKPPFRLP
jgi:multidrug resistance efflux pump